MTTDKQPQTFEEWFDSYYRSYPKDMWSLRDSWNAGRASRDDEIADLKRQVAELSTTSEDSFKLVRRICNQVDEEKAVGLINAYVQERVADARRKGAEEMKESIYDMLSTRDIDCLCGNVRVGKLMRDVLIHPLDAPAPAIGGKGKP